MPRSDDIFNITPPNLLAISKPNILQHNIAPVNPTAISKSHCILEKFSNLDKFLDLLLITFGLSAALLIKMSILPYLSINKFLQLVICDSFVISQLRYKQSVLYFLEIFFEYFYLDYLQCPIK